MACSKELRVPKEWSKYHHDLVNEAINPELFSEDELIDLIITLGLSDSKVKTKKFFDSCRPYHMSRYVYVFIPDNSMSKDIFRQYAFLSQTIFMSDDLMEQFSESEMRQVCDAFQIMDEEICKQFPHFPTLAQMKKSLEVKKINEKVMPHVLYLLEFTNSVGKALIEKGNFKQDDVKDYWRRLVMVTGFYVEGVKSESIQGVTTTIDEYLWRRVMSGAIILWMYGHEIMSEMLGNLNGKQMSFIHELYSFTSIFCLIVNDIYSYEREKIIGNRVMNTVRDKHQAKECSDDLEAFQKSLKIVNAIIKLMYRKIENAKQESPDNAEYHKLLDNIGKGTVGMFFFHDKCTRYNETEWRLTLVEVDEMDLEEWRKSKVVEEFDTVQHFLQDDSPKARRMDEAIKRCVLDMNANVLPS